MSVGMDRACGEGVGRKQTGCSAMTSDDLCHSLIEAEVKAHVLTARNASSACCLALDYQVPPAFQTRFSRYKIMTGPPTPPPSSDLEIQDAARNTVPPEAAPGVPQTTHLPANGAQPTSPTTALQQNRYRNHFQSIAALAAEEKYAQLIKFAEDIDMSVGL